MKKTYLFLTTVVTLSFFTHTSALGFEEKDFRNQALTHVRLALWYTPQVVENKGEVPKDAPKAYPEELEISLERALAQ